MSVTFVRCVNLIWILVSQSHTHTQCVSWEKLCAPQERSNWSVHLSPPHSLPCWHTLHHVALHKRLCMSSCVSRSVWACGTNVWTGTAEVFTVYFDLHSTSYWGSSFSVSLKIISHPWCHTQRVPSWPSFLYCLFKAEQEKDSFKGQD